MELLRSPIRGYAWGSRTAIAGLQGRSVPSAGPEAELWVGAHPADPSTVRRHDTSVSLADLIGAAPDELLGSEVATRFGARLPYLMKVLAADAPLSLQAHPNEEWARKRHADGHPSYVDPHHKPELLVALVPFEALCGFRDPVESAATLAGLGVPALEPVVAALRTGVAGLSSAVRTLLTWPVGERASLVEAALAGSSDPLLGSLAHHYPGDPGVLVALLLNHVRLEPDQAIWMPAGNLHAYLRGTGVEIMAASDNVLRGGLTPKYVDVAELLSVLSFEVLADPVVAAVPVSPGVVTWPVPIAEFALHRVRPVDGGGTAVLPVTGPRVVLCVRGDVTVSDGGEPVSVPSGQAAFVAAGVASLTITGTGEAYVASVPHSS